MDTRTKGNRGEDAAVDYLLSKGYIIETRNYMTKAGEIDIIAKAPDGTIVFVEVKASLSEKYGNPLFRITPSKQKTLTNMAKRYMYENKLTNQPCRIDAIGICNNKIDHLPNAFYLG